MKDNAKTSKILRDHDKQKSITIEKDNLEKVSTWSIVKKIFVALIFISIMVFVSAKYAPTIMDLIKNTDKFRSFILSYGKMGSLIFVSFQIIHILIPFIPGEVVQIAGGYVYGTMMGSCLLILGTLVGTVGVFYIARIIGYPLVKVFVSKKKMESYEVLFNSKKLEVMLFVLFLIPGIPKDILLYITGLLPIKPVKLIVISLTARIPAIIGSAYIGSNLMEKNYTSVIILMSISVILLIVGILFRKRILSIA